MRRFSALDMPATLAAATCVAVFLMCFFSLGSMPRYLAKRRLAQQGEMMVRGFEEAVEAARHDLVQLPAFEELNCRDGISSLLARREFDNEYVRWFGVAQNGHIICRSPVVEVDLPPGEKLYPLDTGWAAAMVHLSWGPQDLVLIQTRSDREYLAMLQPLLFDFENPAGCRGCVSYEAAMGPNQEIAMKAGKPTQPIVVSCIDHGVIFKSQVTLRFSATQQYVNQFKLAGRLAAAGIAAIAALAISLMLYSLLERRTSEANLMMQGLRRNEFLPYYQPIVDARDGSVLGVEAVVRWRRRERMVQPGQFIAFAEESGLIQPITEQVVSKALVDLRRWGWVGTSRYISINAVPDQIVHSDFCEMLVRQLAENGIPGRNLAVEITERHQLTNLAEARSRLLCLAEAGVDIKIDDAGTGFGGFSYVQELPVSTLKIDKMFIDTLRAQGDAKRPVLDAIIHFAKASGLETIAEGVETREQVEYLVRAGVYAIQGFVYARPMPAIELVSWIKAGRARVPSVA